MNAWKPKYTPAELIRNAAQALGITGAAAAVALLLLMI